MVGSDVAILGQMFTWRSSRDFLHLGLCVRSNSSTIQCLTEDNFQGHFHRKVTKCSAVFDISLSAQKVLTPCVLHKILYDII